MSEADSERGRGKGMFHAQAVGELLEAVFTDLGIQKKLKEYQAVLAWEQAAGPDLARHARALGLRRGRLELSVPSGVWRTQLSFSKRELIKRVNDQLGARIVRDLVFVNRGAGKGSGNATTRDEPEAQKRGD